MTKTASYHAQRVRRRRARQSRCLDGSGRAERPAAVQAAEPFELRAGEHISIIGNTLAERMQYDGWLETMLHARFPKHELVIRNLGFSGDESPPARDRRTSGRRMSG